MSLADFVKAADMVVGVEHAVQAIQSDVVKSLLGDYRRLRDLSPSSSWALCFARAIFADLSACKLKLRPGELVSDGSAGAWRMEGAKPENGHLMKAFAKVCGMGLKRLVDGVARPCEALSFIIAHGQGLSVNRIEGILAEPQNTHIDVLDYLYRFV